MIIQKSIAKEPHRVSAIGDSENFRNPFLRHSVDRLALDMQNSKVRTKLKSFLFITLSLFENLKIEDGDGRHFEKLKNRHISATV